jgi:hypothetical protein
MHRAVAPTAQNDVVSCSNATEPPEADAPEADAIMPEVIEDITEASMFGTGEASTRDRKRYRCSRKMDEQMLYKKHKKN